MLKLIRMYSFKFVNKFIKFNSKTSKFFQLDHCFVGGFVEITAC